VEIVLTLAALDDDEYTELAAEATGLMQDYHLRAPRIRSVSRPTW
jgi:hypothetical protein